MLDMKKLKEKVIVNKSYLNEDDEVIVGVSSIELHDIDSFIMCFLESIPEIQKLEGNSIRVLLWCWKLSRYDKDLDTNNEFVVDQLFRNKIREQGGDLTDGVINLGIHNLHKQGFIIRISKGHYYLNPKYFFKGSLNKRSHLRRVINYKPLQPNENFDNIEK